ncbi:hypothetical protein [Afipia felis]|uniref:hypothetical protein n=1 Tax=Afipia felis TaxID=1035 RepID=UPI0002DF53B4|nr:hypothetical protein [Afipia felis]
MVRAKNAMLFVVEADDIFITTSAGEMNGAHSIFRNEKGSGTVPIASHSAGARI